VPWRFAIWSGSASNELTLVQKFASLETNQNKKKLNHPQVLGSPYRKHLSKIDATTEEYDYSVKWTKSKPSEASDKNLLKSK